MVIWILLFGVPMLIGLWAQMKVSGAETAQRILAVANIRDVYFILQATRSR